MPACGWKFAARMSCLAVAASLLASPSVTAWAQDASGTEQPQQKDPLRSLKRFGNKLSNFLNTPDSSQPQEAAPVSVDAKKAAPQDGLWAAAVKRADERIEYFQKSLRYGTDLGVRDAALELQKDPIAVARVNKMQNAEFLKERLNIVNDTVKANTKNSARERIAAHYNVPVSDVTFLEATNPSKTVKLGQDWDITARVRGMDVPIDVAEPIVHEAYYSAATGKKPVAGSSADFAAEARQFAHQQSVEVINYQGREAYGGSRTEGERIISGPKDQTLRDSPQISKAIEVKSNLPREKAMSLEADATRLDAHAAKADTDGRPHEASRLRQDALDKRLDAQGWWMEQARQYSKQFDKQIRPRVEAMGGSVPQHVETTSNILRQMGDGDISPAEGRAKLFAMGETPETAINKGAGLVEAAQTLRAPGAKGPAAPDVVEGNVRDKMALRDLEGNAQTGKTPAVPDSVPGATPGKGGAPAKAREPVRQTAADAPGKPGKGAPAKPGAPAAPDAQPGKALNVAVNVAQFVECMQRRPENTGKASWSMECLKEQAMGLIQDAANDAVMSTITFYAPRLGAVGQVVMAGYGVWVAGGQVGDAVVGGIEWWDALSEEAASVDAGNKSRDRNAAQFALRLADKEAQVSAEIAWINGERRNIANDIARLGREQTALRLKAPPAIEVDRRVREFDRRLKEARTECRDASNGGRQQRLQELSLEQAVDEAMHMARTCRSGDDARQADDAWRRAGELHKALATDPAEALLSDATLYANSIKDMAEQARRIGKEKDAIPGRIRELDTRINQLRVTVDNFVNAFPKDLIDQIKLHSGRIQQMEASIKKAVGGADGADPNGAAQLQNAFADIASTSLDHIIAFAESPNAKPPHFRQVFDELLYEVVRCRAAQRSGTGERGNALFARAEKEYSNLRGACGTKLGEAARQPAPVVVECNTTSKAGANPPQTITVNVGRVAGTVSFSYDMYRVPDHMEVQYGGKVVADTGCVSGRHSIAIPLSGASDQVTVVVKPACQKSEQTRWNFTLSCPGTPGAGGTAEAAARGPAGGMALHEKPAGDVTVHHDRPSESSPLGDSGQLSHGVTLQTGSSGRVVLKSPADTRVTVTEGSQVRLSAGSSGRQRIELQKGTVEVHRREGMAGSDDVAVETEDGTITPVGTRYRVEKTAGGTRVQVFEGSVRLTGGYIVKLHGPNAERGKPSPATELVLHAGEQALMRRTGDAASSAARDTPATPTVEPWNDPKVQQLIDEWLRNATPAVKADLPGPWRFTEWGQVLGPGSKAAGAPDHPAGWTRHQALWAKRMQFDSVNLCSMGEFIERKLAGKGLDGCDRSTPRAVPSWLSPAAAPVQARSDGVSKSANAIAEARAQVQAMQQAQPQQQQVQQQAQPQPREQAVPQQQPPRTSRPLLDRIAAMPDDIWVGGRPDFNGPGFRRALVLVAQAYDPRLPNCAGAAQRAGVTVVGLNTRDDYDYSRWGGQPGFPIAHGYRARDTMYAIETATGRQPILTPIPLNFGYLLDRDGRVIDSGPCEKVVNQLVGRDIGIPDGRR